MGRPFYAVIIPLGEGGHPDQGLPGGGYYPDQGLPGSPPGIWPNPPGGGNYPDQGLPGFGGRPPHPGQGLPGGGRPIDPGFGWGGGERPGHPIAPGGGRPVDPGYGVGEAGPDQGLPPELGPPIGPSHPWQPPEGETLPPPPEEIADQVVVAVWRPDEQQWKVAVADGANAGPHPGQPLPPQRPGRR
jgi:hypothetical protein